MFETTAELAELQPLLDRAHDHATDHLRSIINDGRTLRASEVADLDGGLCVEAGGAVGVPRGRAGATRRGTS